MGQPEIRASTLDLSEEQKLILQNFREKVSDIPHPEINDDTFLVKWLIARNFDLEKAEAMFRKHVLFILANGLDKVKEEFVPTENMNYFFTAPLGYDREGSLVRILNVGASDLRALATSVSRTDAIRFAAYVLLNDRDRQRQERRDDVSCDKQAYIMDLEGLSWRAVIQRQVVEHAFTLLKNYEANYPENLKIVYVVNAPTFFSFIYNWLNTILPASIISKVQVLSQDQVSSVLTNVMDRSILPAYLGGERRDPDGDPACPSLYKVAPGTPFPEHLMSFAQLSVLLNDPEAKRAVIDSGACFSVETNVDESNANLNWDFQTVDYDIRMGLNFKQDKESEATPIIKPHRVDSHMIPETGRFGCQKPGIYELVFDNTYSWLTSKELIYKISVTPPSRLTSTGDPI